MQTTTFKNKYGERIQIRANFSQASSDIKYRYAQPGSDFDGVFRPTPFQVADARHRELEAVKIVNQWLNTGC